jgi:SAM-dependent methyltransferase
VYQDTKKTDHGGGPHHILDYCRRYSQEEMIKYMPYRPGLRVLDCRCGKGVLLDQLDGRTEASWGIDRSRSALGGGDALMPEQVAAAQAVMLPFTAGAFDVVFGHGTLQHVRDSTQVLREMTRVLRPGGHLILWEPRRLLRRTPMPDLRQQMRAVGLVFAGAEAFGYVVYPMSFAISMIPLLSRSALSHSLIKALLAMDSLLRRLPVLHDKSWHLIIVAQKGEVPDAPSCRYPSF